MIAYAVVHGGPSPQFFRSHLFGQISRTLNKTTVTTDLIMEYEMKENERKE